MCENIHGYDAHERHMNTLDLLMFEYLDIWTSFWVTISRSRSLGKGKAIVVK